MYLQQYLVAASRLEQEITWHFPVRSLIPFETWFRGRMAGKVDEELNSRISIDPKFAFFHERRRKNEAEHLCRGEMDLFHITNAQSQFATFETPFVITVHDLAWKRVPKNELPPPAVFGLQHLESLISTADHVICDSECTRQDVLEFIKRKEEDVSTVWLAPRPIFVPPDSDASRFDIRASLNGGVPYFFSVSTIEPRKNYVRAAQAFSRFLSDHPDYQWIICGAKRGAWPDLQSALEKEGIANKVRVLGHVSDETVRQYITGAQALLYPSLYEGFGLPALEAMACGTPVVCSAAGSLGEVVEDAAIIVDPMDVNAIAEGMRSVAGLTDSELTAMRNECLRHAEKFSWKKTAEQTIRIYRQVVGS